VSFYPSLITTMVFELTSEYDEDEEEEDMPEEDSSSFCVSDEA
jgi:hypothetical protein